MAIGEQGPGGEPSTATRPPAPLLDATRWWFFVDVFVLAAAGVQTFVLAEDTDRWFAWTVAPPVSAAVIGAGYFGSIVMVVEARRATRWVDARIVLVSTFLFATLTLAVTLLHLDRFHLDKGGAAARSAAVAWLFVYAVVPPLVLGLVVWQRRTPGRAAPRDGPHLLPPARACLAAEAAALLVVGVVLFGRGRRAEFWPWPLTDLTARAIAAWVLALGAMLALCAWDGEVSRARPSLHTVAAAAVLAIVALVRFHGSVRWELAGAATVAALGALVLTAVGALATARPSRSG
jgi:hypothetical protein